MHRLMISLVVCLALSACSSDSKLETANTHLVSPSLSQASTHEPPDTGEPAMHAVQNSRLQQVMHRINDLVYAQLNNELNLGAERRKTAAEVSRIATELSSSEKAIIETMPSLQLKAGEESTFVALAEKLRVTALQMQASAEQEQWQMIPTHVETITNTCTSCHVLFRKSRSLLEKCKDPRYTC